MLKFFVYNKFIICLYMFRALCSHHQEVKIVLYSIWYCFSCLVYVLLSYVYLLYFFFYFRRRTAGQKSVFGRSCDRSPRHRFFLVSLCLKANAEMVPKIPSCHYMLLMQPSRLKFSNNQFHVLYTCNITTAIGLQPNCSQ